MRRLATILNGLALLISIAATIYLLNAPLYHGSETSCIGNECETIETTQTLVEANGLRVVYQLIVVTLVSSLPFLAAFARPAAQRLVTWGSALLLLAYSIAGAFTVGLAFMPSALLLVIAAIFTSFIRKDTDLQDAKAANDM
ncbi:MAG TPA: hypothetical protein VJ987_09275 [Anaerolineales bacterium]|nr:hypothetical protein [Anaerolineales bacterium]